MLFSLCHSLPAQAKQPSPAIPAAPQLVKVQLLIDTNGNEQLLSLLNRAFYDLAAKNFPYLSLETDPQPYTLFVMAGHHNDTLAISSVLFKRQNLSIVSGFLKASGNPMAGWLERQDLGKIVQRSLYLTPFIEGQVFDSVFKKLSFYDEQEFQQYLPKDNE